MCSYNAVSRDNPMGYKCMILANLATFERIMPIMHLIPGLALKTTSDIQILDPSQTQYHFKLTSN